MLPVCDVIPSRVRPFTVFAVLALMACGFLAQLQTGPAAQAGLFASYGVLPVAFVPWTAVTAPFLHAGWVHAGSNLLCLYLFGENVEGALGRIGFLALFYTAAIAGAAGYVVTRPDSAVPLVGASSAVAGLIGTYLVLYPKSQVLTLVVPSMRVVEVPAIFFAGLWFVFQLLSPVGSVGGRAADGAQGLGAHLAGLVAGVLWGLGARLRRRPLRAYWSGMD